ncbi:MAG: RIP metalloprotease RseP [Flavobacteriales bacterium]|jgi:regulator of sigma E protease|nr:RIP metalloprotease RseP [Flavobacteriales bacterium]MBT3963041.1 RIP metalloprotease RseP [Flavobacteriales bacterium]MBT4704292.1 RIP metalloprotease RseP [Flavobacteriales bacterium]MBT4930552.1 RIP metalloprotease RseP [Flavobacteriales bacterium]MBT5131827.1 RIP metalloprotease RseP [Flavobacteriales bacterium]
MEVFLIKAAQLILSLSILIVLHELGHFIPAKLFKTRVEKFYLFFDPWFSLIKFKRGDTQYGIGWLPLGGYVKISGMIDESMDKEAMSKPAEPWEFRSKPAWQRLIIMVGGVTVNIILAFLIYSMVLYTWGKEKVPLANLKYGVYVDDSLEPFGLRDGDHIVGLADGNAEFLGDLGKEILISEARQVEVNRDGVIEIVTLPDTIDQVLLREKVRSLFNLRFPFEVDSIIAGAAAESAGLQKNDRILAVAGEPTLGYLEGFAAIQGHPGETVSINIDRDGELVEMQVSISEAGKIGIGLKLVDSFIETKTYRYGFFEAIPAGFFETGKILSSYISSLKLVFTKEGASSIGGFGAIGGLFPATWNWQAFWTMTAFLSLILAFMNILPIPALDGGHVMFLIYEMVTGRKPGDKFMEYAQATGMILLLTLLVYANGNDIIRAISG